MALVCKGTASTSYSASAANAGSYSWTLTPPSAGQINTSGTVTWDPTFLGTATVQVQAGNNCGNTSTDAMTVEVKDLVTYYLDEDRDGFSAGQVVDCINPNTALYVTVDQIQGSNDCDDKDDKVHPETVWFLDADGDGHGAVNGSVQGCEPPNLNYNDYTLVEIPEDDCDDSDGQITGPKIWSLDSEGDGHALSKTTSCTNPGPGYVQQDLPLGDCDGDTYYNATNYCGSNEPCASGGELTLNITGNNYVYSRSYQKSSADMLAKGVDQNNFGFFTASDDVVQQITYFDGLGRPIQQIGMDQSYQWNSNVLTKNDLITHIGYDDFGRQVSEWLPVPEGTGNMGVFRTLDLETATRDHYKAEYTNDFTNLTGTAINSYSEKDFEESPLNRLLRQAAPGEDWRMDGGHEIGFGYEVNIASDAVKQYRVNTVFANNTYSANLVQSTDYAAGELYKNITKDENHDGTTSKLHTTEEFTDKQGRVVLKRTYALVNSVEESHDTYYVYDDFGNLTYVLPPKMDASSATLANINANLNELGYQYVYDHRNRLVEKRIPGKGKEYIVYNKLDQPIMTQDANMRVADNPQLTSDYWLFTKYDAFGRVAYTGKASVTNGTSRTDIQDDVDNETILWEDPSSTFSNGSIDVGHGNDAYPTSNIEVLTINYYDDYSFNPTSGTSVSSFTVNSTPNTKGLATGSRVKVLEQDPAKWITTATYYDEKARPIYTYSENEFLSTVDIVESELDFVGKPLRVRSSQTRNNVTVATLDNFEYDHVGRLLKQTQCIGDENLGYSCGASAVPVNLELLAASYTSDQTASTKIEVKATNNPVTLSGTLTLKIDSTSAGTGGPEELIAYNKYDELGQLVQKKVGGTPGSDYETTTQSLQTVDYTYNVRGWLKGINDVTDTTPDKLFNFSIGYNQGSTPLYNGNISRTEWRTDNDDSSLKSYDYTYDALNRIMSATDNTGKFNISGITYDKNGNIGKLKRMGWTSAIPSLANNTGLGTMDDLTYGYQANSNKLTNVSDDNASDTYGFVDVNGSGTEYAYDANGNLTSDLNKGISSVEYNHLNMPTKITVTGGNAGMLDYVYAADSTKLRKVNSNGTTTDYIGNYVYENGDLKQITQPEGYIEPNGNSWQHVYYLKDHLHNVRITFSDDNENGVIETGSNYSEIRREQNYYPFGLEHKGYNDVVQGAKNDLKTYQDQEFTEDLGLNTHEWKYRVSDPALGRFWQIDPLAEDYVYNGVYNFSENRVIDGWELEGLEFYPMNSSTTARSQINEIRNGPFKKEAEIAGGVAFFGGLAALATISIGARALGGILVNEAKDEVISQATGGLSDFVDLSKMATKGIKAGIKKIKDHLANPDLNLDPDVANDVMLDRLDKIAKGEIEATPLDTNFFNHEVRESEHVANGLSYDEAHVQTLKDQGIDYKKGFEKELYTDEALKKGDEALREAANN